MICDGLVRESKDPLTIQPACLELATIRKKPEDELGMHIQSTYNGTHIIEGIKEQVYTFYVYWLQMSENTITL